ncbi:MAG: ABC transporter ATP-binding protein [Chloroflexi bacterium]|nr:MAG: ABC transporter ATP-binding protein [Chloroflexota bacterium]
MSFIWPAMLVSLVLIPLLAALYLRMQRRRRQMIARYGTLGLVREAGGRPLGVRRHLPPILFLTGLAILLVALARPQAVVSLPRLEGTVILAFDVSGSMAADDLEPTRMEAAKAAARDFVARQPPTVRVGVVAFSDSGFSVQPPTNEQEALLAAINRLGPERSTSLAHGIVTSLNTIFADASQAPRLYSNYTPAPTPSPTPVPAGTYAPAVIVLLTDGENTTPEDPFEAAQAAADRGVRIHTVGIGSPEGAILELEGFSVHTRLDEAMLQQIAEQTDGVYYNAQNEEELRAIYENLDTQLVVKPDEMEVTSLFAGAGFLFLLVGGAFSLLWFSRVP